MSFKDMFNINYKEILLVANRITRRKNISLSPELISETYLYLVIKEYPLDNLEFVKWFSKSMRNQYVWGTSTFNKIYRLDVETKTNKHLSYKPHTETQHTNLNDYLCLDNIPSQDPIKNIDPKVIELFKKSLPLHERYTFEVYYEHNLSTRQISKELNYEITYLTINEFVNNIKTKIKKYTWEHD